MKSAVELTLKDIDPLIHHLARRLERATGWKDRDTILSEAYWAFLEAYKTYDPKKGAFTTHLWITVSRKVLALYSKRVWEKTRQKDIPLDKFPSRERFDTRKFLAELSYDAQILTVLSLEPPTPKKRMSKKNTIIQYLKDIGWSLVRIERTWKEVEENLS